MTRKYGQRFAYYWLGYAVAAILFHYENLLGGVITLVMGWLLLSLIFAYPRRS